MSAHRLIHNLRAYPSTQDFVYLTRVDGGSEYNPYALKVASFGNIDPNAHHFTLSASGITYYHAGATDFTSLDRWEREVQLFIALRKFKVWHQFRLWKV
jgi:hypothetical protein